MITAADFTARLTDLLNQMRKDKEFPSVHYCYRSKEEQNRLFKEGLSKCDGYQRLSNHQRMRAADVYLSDGKGKIFWEWDEKKARYYHKKWEGYGGKEMIEWDRGHYEI